MRHDPSYEQLEVNADNLLKSTPPFPVVGKKCNQNPNPNRKMTEMSRTGNLLLLISSLILRCFSKTFSFIVYFYIFETHRL
jgi:hypothetical protein